VKYHDAEHGRLIQVDHKASAEFWDEKWSADSVASYDSQAVLPFVDLTKRFLPPGSRVLEGGCGAGGKVAALTAAGYRMVGVDYAPETVSRLNQSCPEFDIRVGDVFQLDFPDGQFDGYWSFGVIEHFWNGYGGILAEARRVLRDNGYLFLTFPSMSPLRQLKARLGAYSFWKGGTTEPTGFYQFLLSPDIACKDLQDAGFSIAHCSRIQTTSGVKQELKYLWHACSLVGTRFPESLQRMMADAVELSLRDLIGHLTLIAARKNAD